jgi:hypothetical protein
VRAGWVAGGEVREVLATGRRFTVLSGPVEVDGYGWYQGYPNGPVLGWVAAEFLVLA